MIVGTLASGDTSGSVVSGLSKIDIVLISYGDVGKSISAMENDLGENVWDFRGGFYNKDGEITPWCRHVWKAVTKIRRKK